MRYMTDISINAKNNRIMKIEWQDKIDDYLLDRMSDEDRQTFEQEIANDTELKEQLEFTQDMQQAIQSRNEKLAAMKEWEDDYIWEKQKPPIPIKRFVYWVSGVAAVFVVGLLIIQNVFLMPSNVDINGMLREGSSYAYIDTLIMNEKYEEALVQIKEKTQLNQNDSKVVSQDSLMSKETFEYEMLLIKERQDDLKWQTALALLGMGQKEEALIQLDELRNEKGVYQKDAKTLYKLVKKEK